MAVSSTPKKQQLQRGAPATTPEARENQLIGMAYDRAEQQIADGTASSQVLVHFLKLKSEREELEKERLRRQIAVLEAQREQYGSIEAQTQLYENALKAFSRYQGNDVEEEEFYDD